MHLQCLSAQAWQGKADTDRHDDGDAKIYRTQAQPFSHYAIDAFGDAVDVDADSGRISNMAGLSNLKQA